MFTEAAICDGFIYCRLLFVGAALPNAVAAPVSVLWDYDYCIELIISEAEVAYLTPPLLVMVGFEGCVAFIYC